MMIFMRYGDHQVSGDCFQEESMLQILLWGRIAGNCENKRNFRWWPQTKFFQVMDPKQSFQEENGYCGIFRLWEFPLIIFNPLSTNQSNQGSEVLSLFAFLSIMIIRYHNTNFFLSYASCPWSPPHPIHCHTLPPSIHPIPPPYHPNPSPWELLCR